MEKPKPSQDFAQYRKLSSDELLKKTHAAVAEEREIQAEVLRLLAEVDRRRLYAYLGFRSLFEFCVKELRYSESSAWRRISAMRLLKDIPQAEKKLITGELNLKTLTSVQNFLATEERQLHRTFTPEQKQQILQAVVNKSSRETEVILASLSPISTSPHERERQLSDQDIEIRFIADTPLVDKLHRLKDLNSHRDPTRSYKGLFDWLSELGLKTSDPLLKRSRSAGPAESTRSSSRSSDTASPSPMNSDARARKDRYIPNGLRLQVWRRDGGRCTFTNKQTGRRCDARSFIEIDHIIPHALGGATTLENLRLYCRTHNQEAARLAYGSHKIDSEIRKRAEPKGSASISSDGSREPAPASAHGEPMPDQSSA